MKSSTIAYIAASSFLFIWYAVASNFLLKLLLSIAFIPRFLSYTIITIMPWILLYELVTKGLLLSTIPSKLQIVPTQIEGITEIDQNTFVNYTSALESLGFIRISDLKLSESSVTVVRLFSHPNHLCFAEVLQVVGKDYIFCAIGSELEQEWSISTRDKTHQTTAITYAFLRNSKGIIVYKEGANPQALLDAHLELRQQVMRDLKIEIIPDVSLEYYFESGKKSRRQHKQMLWRKSVIVGMIKMMLFSLNPQNDKYQWLGDYASLANRRKSA